MDEPEEEEDMEIDEEAIKQEIRRREERLREAKILYEYRTKLKENTLTSFTDKPEPVTEIYLLNSTPTQLCFEWKEP